MAREDFFDWAEARDDGYEFDGRRPVAMGGWTVRHSVIARNARFAVGNRLAKSCGCAEFGIGVGIRTVGAAVRYPDVIVTCSKFKDSDREVPNPVVVFEVLSPTSGHTDRIVKLLEYKAVPSIRRYVIVEHDFAALTLYARHDAGADWTATVLTADKLLPLPEIGIEIPVADLFAKTDLAPTNEEPAAE
jgi:Uma2 family endonuclease